MCGIVGYVGEKRLCSHIVDLLKRLEYRGYDSAGIAYQKKCSIKIIKNVGNIKKLEGILPKNEYLNCGIAHTRWATHGKPSVNNAHPITSQNGQWAVVHNGIIENFFNLKVELKKIGVVFSGETDTEIIANLLEQEKTNITNIKKVINVCNKLVGSYALACINNLNKNSIYLAKNKSPLYVAKTLKGIIVASDPICFAGEATNYYTLNDGDFCEISINNIKFFDKNLNKIEKQVHKLKNIDYYEDKKNYTHYMLKEIEETGTVLKSIYETYKKENILSVFDKKFILKHKKIIFVGCGTAYHAGLMGANYVQDLCKMPSSANVASEFRYSNPIVDKETIVVLISQSGETADTLAACDLVKKMGATTIALTNSMHSSLVQRADFVLPICAGPEIAVASTKAFSAMLAVLYMFTSHLKNKIGSAKTNYLKHIYNLANSTIMPKTQDVISLAKEVASQTKVFFIGRDKDYILSEEASLKLKEISYINCSAHPAGELKHGFLALIDNGTFVFVTATIQELLEKSLNGANEAMARGGKIILITNKRISNKKLNFYKIIKLRCVNKNLMPIVTIVYFQLLAYYTSILKNINPDQPRNLAKSVTVE